MFEIGACSDRIRDRVAPLVRAALIATLGSIFVLTTACNTIEGAGEDIEAGGDAIEEAADGD